MTDKWLSEKENKEYREELLRKIYAKEYLTDSPELVAEVLLEVISEKDSQIASLKHTVEVCLGVEDTLKKKIASLKELVKEAYYISGGDQRFYNADWLKRAKEHTNV